jgi:hypothetical protein
LPSPIFPVRAASQMVSATRWVGEVGRHGYL